MSTLSFGTALLEILFFFEPGAHTEPAASPVGAGGPAGESTHHAQRARFAAETRRGQVPRFELPGRSGQSDRLPHAGAAAFWSAERAASGMTNAELWDYGVRFRGQPADGTPSSSEWNTRGPREWRRPGGAVLEGERRRPVANPSRGEPMPVVAPIRVSRAESMKRHRPTVGGGAPDEHPALPDVTASVGPVCKEARIVGHTSNGPLVEESAPEEWAQIYDAFQVHTILET